ncbi:MAG: hypothetical protein AAFY36_14580 [Bacteroidota bacterium]
MKIDYPFHDEFCSELEYKLSVDSFKSLGDQRVSGFWCDGIDHIPNNPRDLSINRIEQNRQISTRAWIGKDGQDLYEMTIHFGNDSIACYRMKKSIIDCIPEGDLCDWVRIWPEERRIEIYLE